MDSHGLLDRHASHLTLSANAPHLTLGEGNTPLLATSRLAEWVGVRALWLKIEGMNPTGSFKDRGMVVAVAQAVAEGATTILCASTGNTSASAAAYGARIGVRTVVLLPAGRVSRGKLAQAMAAGATIVSLNTGFDGALELARTLATSWRVALVNSVNPFRIMGQMTAAYEICDTLGDAPDILALPVGNGGNVTAYGRGFARYHALGHATRIPRLIGGQAAGAAPLVHGHPVESPDTIATAIRIGKPASWESASEVVQASQGFFRAVPDDAILEAQAEIARREGVFCEPASAAGVAALRVAVREGAVDPQAQSVCVLTGHGLKDPDTVPPGAPTHEHVSADPGAVAELLGLVARG